ncbi:MAG: Na+/H+ antiporter NhaC family protein [Acidaminococcus fermentans]|uniref:Na+/H+ antiporter family protein n=1 Tax=Acidaminococcus fermentans TaxID=905 RepID=UPI002430D08F|nr:Na+/H+ antiporter NhaC family protein [Acidaminococcus fermentans]MCI6286051.1 sodium:proton antiporter [Acidaminococcus fermentans]MDD7195419.1 Na+/H+ antiporter NhaC family protein [Acidaminococcus fermentans]MDY2852022.1 Na+/H+ antiporter NhaC family protein [Acidaminococcus fermentans]
MEILTNPIVVSVIVMSVLCLLKMNVLFAILVAAIVAGSTGGLAIDKTVSILIGGMGGNSETALSYILLGTLAVAIGRSGVADIAARKITKVVGTKKAAFVFLIAFVSCFSQNLIPVHIAFIPILIPPLLVVMNHMKLDRRAVACALTFGLKAPYVSLPVGFGLLFMTIIKDQMVANNVQVSISDISSVMWIGGASMLVGLILSTIFYSRDREYKDLPIMGQDEKAGETEMNADCWKALAGAVAAFVAQLYFKSLPIGAMCGLLVMLATGAIKWNKMDEMVDGGVKMMGFIAFVMLVAAGYANVLRETHSVEALVMATTAVINTKLSGAILMLAVGLLITMGIGTSFGTIPVVASIYIPMGLKLGFGIPSIILLIGIAAALGDAGSPASDSTLGPTSGLNADGQHNHIWDTCVPTFIFFDVTLFIGGVIGAMILG